MSPAPATIPSERLPQHVAWRLFLTVHALACQKIDDGLRATGCLSFDDYDVLLTVNEAPDETLTMSELAEAVLLSKSGMSRRVSRLVERSLLLRQQSSSDARVIRVRMSASGRRALNQAWEAYQPLIERCFAEHLTDQEAQQMGTIYQRVLDRIGGAAHKHLLENQVTDAPKAKN